MTLQEMGKNKPWVSPFLTRSNLLKSWSTTPSQASCFTEAGRKSVETHFCASVSSCNSCSYDWNGGTVLS
jgi:hypothetical protein